MQKRRVTSTQVANKAGVSRTTVSLVLNHATNANISEATRQRVFQVAEELGYVPDASAQALVQGFSRNIALVIFQPSYQMFFDPYLSQILSGITRVVREQGFRLTIEVVEDHGEIRQVVNLLRSGAVDGIITEHWIDARQMLDAGLTSDAPVVVLSEGPLDGFYHVYADTIAGQRKLLQHLVDRGHVEIACIPYTDPQNSRSLANRLQDYRTLLTALGIAVTDDWIIPGDYGIETGYRATQQLLDLTPLPTAIYAMNDSMAFGTLRALADAGLRVPADVAVVGHDDHRNAAWTTPALTTVHVPWLELGSAAATMLIQLISGQTVANKSIQLHPELIVRESCG